MATKPLPSPEVLRQLLRYEPDTGKMFWLPRPRSMFADRRDFGTWNTRYAGQEAFAILRADGYKIGALFGEKYSSHRTAWALFYGAHPDGIIDHINGDPSDNRLANLRRVTAVGNAQNARMPVTNKSGVKGVHWNTARGKWRAAISVANKLHALGDYDDKTEAAKAYAKASALFHGEFARAALTTPEKY